MKERNQSEQERNKSGKERFKSWTANSKNGTERNQHRTEGRRSLKTDWKLIARGFRVLYDVCPQNMIWRTVKCITHQLAPYFTLYLSAEIISRLAAGASFQSLLTLALITVSGQLLLNLSMHFTDRKAEEMESINYDLNELYMLKVQCRMQYKHLENPETAQLRQRIRNHSNYGGHGLSNLYWNYWTFLSAIVNIIFSVSLTVSLLRRVSGANLSGFLAFVNHPFSVLVLFALIGINIVAQMINIYHFEPEKTKIWSDFNLRFARSNRYMIFGPDTVLMGAVALSMARCRSVLVEDGHLRESFKNRMAQNTVSRLLEAVTNLILYVYVGAKAYIGAFGIGNFVLYTGTVNKFVEAVSDLGGCFSSMRQNNEYLIELYRFLDLPDEMYHGTLSVEKREDNKFEIEFRNVSFKYPGSDSYALKNVNFKFQLGERLAFVGMNGSGKTTFVKLLCRLYDPTEGQILLKGIDISRYDYDQYLRLFSVVFQDIFLFAFSLGENISAQTDYEEEKVKACLQKVNFEERLSELEQGLQTAYGRMYQNDGVEFSGGEAQKIALARALYKDAPYIVLDEPTAALDPLAEAEVYSSFNEIMDGKTAIYVSHRLSSCRFADKILVFHEGQIVQQGSHEELVNEKSGKYYELWNAQAKYYAREQ